MVQFQIFLNGPSLINAVLRSPGTAQIGEGIENSWGDLEESEREEDEDEAAADYCSTLDDQNMEIGEANLETRNKTGQYLFSTALERS